ncbi:MAG: hypothetical protein OXB95_04755 [Rhodobacteraceae bacterium]|nr:hypothetical protein [Paracoccaceae bacterium]
MRLLEFRSLQNIFERLERESGDVTLSSDKTEVTIDGTVYPIDRLKYVMNEDRSEEIFFVSRAKAKKRILQITAASSVQEHYSHPGIYIRREVLETQGLAEPTVARMLGVEQSELSDLLDGKMVLTPDRALQLETLFGVSMNTLLHMQAIFFASKPH